MANTLNKPMFHIVLLLVLAMAVASCGRRGNLEAPGTVQSQSVEQDVTTPKPEPVEEKEDKSFILDGLL